MILRRTQPDVVRSFKLPGLFMGVAALITAFNVFIFTVGGFQWGKTVWLPGTVILLLFVPFYFYRSSSGGTTGCSSRNGGCCSAPFCDRPTGPDRPCRVRG